MEVEEASEAAVGSLLSDPVVVAWRLRDHEEVEGFLGVIPK